jgi:hypothetical protein
MLTKWNFGSFCTPLKGGFYIFNYPRGLALHFNLCTLIFLVLYVGFLPPLFGIFGQNLFFVKENGFLSGSQPFYFSYFSLKMDTFIFLIRLFVWLCILICVRRFLKIRTPLFLFYKNVRFLPKTWYSKYFYIFIV